MAQRLKVRLGDGTVLTVDPDELQAWREDGRATVQAAGTQQWRPLREVLAEQESAERLARALVPPEAQRPAAPRPSAPPIVQALAEEPTDSAPPPWRRAQAPADEAPVLRLKPIDDEPPPPDTVPRAGKFEDDGEPASRHARLDGPLLRALSTFGNFLSRCLDRLTPQVQGRPSKPPSEPATRRPPPPARAASSGRRAGPPPTARAPLAPPVPATELPALRFAESKETPEPEDVYECEEAPRLLPALWRWAVRAAVVGGLVAGGVFAALYWETWFPRAGEVGQKIFAEIDRQARSGQRSAELQRALGEAAERVPHLSPETISLVLTSSEGVVPDPPTVFQLANEAADRGLGALAPTEAAELQALRRELLANLRPPQRARLAEYERARATRGVFPFENPPALELVASGARAMPAPRRERLQTLLGKAVAAGLAAPAP